MGFSWGRFDTRTIVLIPIAIAINIVLGQTVGSVLKIPIYLDSIGTILVGVLAGPIPGLVTGLLTNLIWTYVLPPPLQSPYAAPFAIVAAEIGFLSGVFGQIGSFRSRPNAGWGQIGLAALLVVVVLGGIGFYGFLPFYAGEDFTFFGDTSTASPFFLAIGYLIAIGIASIIGLLILLFVRRDVGVAYVAIAGLIVGIISAIISAPISAVVFGGVTGSGSDLLVAAFQQAGSDLQTAVLQQGLLQDPIDKTMEFLIAFVILQTLSRRFVARFPRGRRRSASRRRHRSGLVRPVVRATDLDPDDAARITRLVPATPSSYHRLNPLTKAVIATVGSIGAFVLGGYVGPIAIIALMLLLAGGRASSAWRVCRCCSRCRSPSRSCS